MLLSANFVELRDLNRGDFVIKIIFLRKPFLIFKVRIEGILFLVRVKLSLRDGCNKDGLKEKLVSV